MTTVMVVLFCKVQRVLERLCCLFGSMYSSKWMDMMAPLSWFAVLFILCSWSAPRDNKGVIHHVIPPWETAKESWIMDLLLPVGWHRKMGAGSMHLQKVNTNIKLPWKRYEKKVALHEFTDDFSQACIRRAWNGIIRAICGGSRYQGGRVWGGHHCRCDGVVKMPC